jgi:NAD(P)-dependent dehydrogenase (short-subunit alcohol dehydrogenase family)
MAAGLTYLVTGANAGIGLEIARGLVRTGGRVVLACRSAPKAEAARAELEREKPKGALEILLVDLASQRSIREAALKLAAEHRSLDVLVNNAGIVEKKRRESPDGIELTFATNVLAYHVLTTLLRPLLEAAPAARIVNVASAMAYGLDLTDVEWKRRPYDGAAAYAQSKQANRMLTWALARRLHGTKITANAMHPGPVSTALLHSLFPNMSGRSTAQGADTAVWLATSSDVAGKSGRFWSDRREVPCQFHDEAQEEALWSLCDGMIRT